jgi:hypothetical protein
MFFVLWTVAVPAQTPPVPSAATPPVVAGSEGESEQDAADEPGPGEKREGIDRAAALAQCARPEYRGCLALDVAGCEAVTAVAVDKANAEVEALAAKRTEEQIQTPFFQGMVLGVYIRHMDAGTDGRFMACMQQRE